MHSPEDGEGSKNVQDGRAMKKVSGRLLLLLLVVVLSVIFFLPSIPICTGPSGLGQIDLAEQRHHAWVGSPRRHPLGHGSGRRPGGGDRRGSFRRGATRRVGRQEDSR